MQTVIETKSLCKTYGRQKAVDHVELHVPQGSTVLSAPTAPEKAPP